MNFIDVKTDFGAVGNDLADDTAAIQAALDAGTGPVFIPAGTYKFSTLEIPVRARVFGGGRGMTVLRSTVSGTTPAIRNKAAAETGGQYTYDVVLRDLSLRGTDGQGGTGLYLSGFRRGIFENLDVDMFRNAGNTGRGIHLVCNTKNTAYNHFAGIHVRNCDDAVTLEPTNATYTVIGNTFHGLFIEQEVNCLQILSMPGRLPSGNCVYGLIIQGNGTGSGSSCYYIRCDGSGNFIDCPMIDGHNPNGTTLAFTNAGGGANTVRISVLDPAKFVNLQTAGPGNVVDVPQVNSGSPGKPYRLWDIAGTLIRQLHGGPHPSNVEVWYGNNGGLQMFRHVMDAAAQTFTLYNNNFGSHIAHKQYHRFFAGHPTFLEHMRITSGGAVVSDSSITSDVDPGAAFEVRSTTKPLLPPRMTTLQRNAIPSPVPGAMVYDTTLNRLFVREGTAWVEK